MKSQTSLILLLFFVCSSLFKAQPGIPVGTQSLNRTVEAYYPFTDGFTQTLTNRSNLVEVPLGFPLHINGKIINSVYCGVNGYVSYDKAFEAQRIYAGHVNINSNSLESVVCFKTESSLKGPVCKIQWETTGSSVYANTQLWLYENGLVEIHIGKITIPLAAENNSKLISLGFATLMTGSWSLSNITGNPPFERLLSNTGQITDFFREGLDAIPFTGTVYSIRTVY